ncbi:amino acid ABC transporter permease [Poseidonocella sp. HB161398]|uniref:amino acid ABC transporter permease n=1 Tax=Poseidonocella sp. HB161398 TaxID=2320855 RepID=UPI00110943EF|nr:amino acid ABC transporter permease [Poseidonocella sp. HB161398]
MDYAWNWAIFPAPSADGTGSYLSLLLSGLGWTLATAALSWGLALPLGMLLGILRTLPQRGPRLACDAYAELFRNIPLIVQMFLWYVVLPELLPEPAGTWLKRLPNAAFATAVLSLGRYTAARVSEQVRAGIESLPRGQRQAGIALGLSPAQVHASVLLPNALRIVLPALASEFLNNTKNTSVAMTIGLMELTARARSMQEYSFQVFEAFAAATLLYLAVNAVDVRAMALAERRLALPGLSRPRGDGHAF